jgi:hypothetical protein
MAELLLRDIHQPAAPPWWPPAPGWWLIGALLLLLVAFAGARAWRRHRRRRALQRLFDDALARAATPAAQVAAMSELLRRAARRRDPAADRLQGDAWLRFLDQGLKTPVFASTAGCVLHDGGYRRELPAEAADALRPLARARFLDWMSA